MRAFTLFRRNPPATHTSGGYANQPDEPQLEGIVFTDGSVAVRWLTEYQSTSLWESFEDFETVHGHPEYDSRVIWHPVGDGAEVPTVKRSLTDEDIQLITNGVASQLVRAFAPQEVRQ